MSDATGSENLIQAPFEYEGQWIEPARHPLETGLPPSWASGWGQDEFGVFAELTVVDVTQKLRWIPPGKFLMGSPEDESGRWADEGPQHDRTIEHGFWLFDTPVTQALWVAVMDNNPSHFEGPERPVESVSWKDAQEFCTRMNNLVSGLSLRLPSEAEWEYACRAGTSEATYAGSLSFEDKKVDRALLDRIAWYSENAGGQTQSIGGKKPNDFGLYDMLGNVLEWCADEWHDSFEAAPSDASAWQDIFSDLRRVLRVFRGGSWGDDARDVRAAYRSRFGPSLRNGNLGFRCAGGPVELRQAARSAGNAEEIS
ncbi:formylglycine-generating enzyme family protein [Roseibium sediminis]|uniref:formylglycine-generating enzyme family protein n=1 Tax=Roseibium sediminis TaxID=1775174 RepID=UPI00123CDC4A|nr:formylglycine-generating enzyme family protein [Roseibium sediminis]